MPQFQAHRIERELDDLILSYVIALGLLHESESPHMHNLISTPVLMFSYYKAVAFLEPSKKSQIKSLLFRL